MKGIQYLLTLHLREVQELGIDINLVDLCIFEFLLSFKTKTYCHEEMLDDGEIYFWVSHDLIISQLPILGIKSKRRIISHINNLVKVGLLIRYENIRGVKKSYYRFGQLADKFGNGYSTMTETSHHYDGNVTPTMTETSHNNIQEDNNNNIPPLPPEGEFSTQKAEKKKAKNIVEDFVETSVEDNFKPIMREWCAYKREKGQSYKPTGLKTCYAKLLKLSNNNPDTARQIIEQSMASNWAGLFAIKDALQKKQHGCMSVGVKINTDEMNYDKSTDWG